MADDLTQQLRDHPLAQDPRITISNVEVDPDIPDRLNMTIKVPKYYLDKDELEEE